MLFPFNCNLQNVRFEAMYSTVCFGAVSTSRRDPNDVMYIVCNDVMYIVY